MPAVLFHLSSFTCPLSPASISSPAAPSRPDGSFHLWSTMSKLLLLSVIFCASLALILTLQWRTRSILVPNSNANFDPLSMRRQLLMSYGLRGWKFFKPKGADADPLLDPRTVDVKDAPVETPARDDVLEIHAKDDAIGFDAPPEPPVLAPISVCGRVAPIPHDIEALVGRKFSDCRLMRRPPRNTDLLLLYGVETFGRTGNNLIEFLHSLQYARENDALVGIMMGSWPTHLITNMWMSIQNGNIPAWRAFVEQSFCVKLIDHEIELANYKNVIRMETRDLFLYKSNSSRDQYAEHQGHILRTLYRSYNDGRGLNMRKKIVGDMCSVLDAIFGRKKHSVVYSVVHSRSLEGDPGVSLLGRIARNVGCDPMAALDMEPEYVKAILAPLGMLDRPIVFITDHQRPEILDKLLADPDIGRNIHLIPEEASWVGGDITAAVMANVFIGNPASSFSGFIAKSRVALGYDTNYLFRKKIRGEWVDVCDELCIFDKNVMNAMA